MVTSCGRLSLRPAPVTRMNRLRVRSASSVGVHYEGAPLAQRTRYWWRVRDWDASGAVTAWSEAAFWETGLLGSSEGKARWIGLRQNAEDNVPCPFLRRSFVLRGAVRCAPQNCRCGLLPGGRKPWSGCAAPSSSPNVRLTLASRWPARRKDQNW